MIDCVHKPGYHMHMHSFLSSLLNRIRTLTHVLIRNSITKSLLWVRSEVRKTYLWLQRRTQIYHYWQLPRRRPNPVTGVSQQQIKPYKTPVLNPKRVAGNPISKRRYNLLEWRYALLKPHLGWAEHRRILFWQCSGSRG